MTVRPSIRTTPAHERPTEPTSSELPIDRLLSTSEKGVAGHPYVPDRDHQIAAGPHRRPVPERHLGEATAGRTRSLTRSATVVGVVRRRRRGMIYLRPMSVGRYRSTSSYEARVPMRRTGTASAKSPPMTATSTTSSIRPVSGRPNAITRPRIQKTSTTSRARRTSRSTPPVYAPCLLVRPHLRTGTPLNRRSTRGNSKLQRSIGRAVRRPGAVDGKCRALRASLRTP